MRLFGITLFNVSIFAVVKLVFILPLLVYVLAQRPDVMSLSNSETFNFDFTPVFKNAVSTLSIL